MAGESEYELVPLTPIRRLEKEIAELKKARGPDTTGFLINEIVDILKMNQKIVDDMTRLHGELMSKLSRTADKIDKLVNSIEKLVEILGEATEAELATEAGGAPAGGRAMSSSAEEKMDKIIEQNAALINSLKVLSNSLSKLGDLEKGLSKLNSLEKDMKDLEKSSRWGGGR